MCNSDLNHQNVQVRTSSVCIFKALKNLHVTEENPEACGRVRAEEDLLSCWDCWAQHGPVPSSLYVLHVSSCPVLSELILSTHVLPYSLVTPLLPCFLSPLPPPIPSAFQIFTSEITCFGLLTHLPTSFWRQPPWLILALFTPLFLLTDFLPKRTALPLPPFNIFSDIILRP